MSENLESFDGHIPQVALDAYVHRTAVVIGRVRLASGVSLWPNVTLRGDEGEIVVGENSNVQDGSVVHVTGGRGGAPGTNSEIGARVTVGHGCIIHGCRVEDDCLIGMGATILDDAVIGRGSYIGAGTLVTGGKLIPPGSFVLGNPFRVVRAVGPREVEWIDYAWRHYRDLALRYQAGARRP